jgi:hypothetical protein
MRKTIKLVTANSKYHWNRFINENLFNRATTELVVDFNKCDFIEPFHIVLLACLIEDYHRNQIPIIFEKGSNLPLNEYLSYIKFWDYWQPNFERTSFNQNGNITNLCLWQLSPTKLSSYVVYAQEYFENNFSNERSFEPLNVSLAELFNNIIDHSQSLVSGYTTNQYYPKSNKLKIAVCDLGIGIPNKINNYLVSQGKPTISSIIALSKSFEKGYSTKSSPKNRGFGLDTLMTIAKNSNGSLKVISNDAMLILKPNEVTKLFPLNYNFHGTHFEMILDVNTFYEKNNEIFDEDFFF